MAISAKGGAARAIIRTVTPRRPNDTLRGAVQTTALATAGSAFWRSHLLLNHRSLGGQSRWPRAAPIRMRPMRITMGCGFAAGMGVVMMLPTTHTSRAAVRARPSHVGLGG